MKVVMTLLVRNEEDILEDNLDFHLSQGIEMFIVTDNRSTDATRRILKEYERGGHLVYIYEGADNFSQNDWVTRMARMAAVDYGADWVINSDADEFWWPSEGTLVESFTSLASKCNILQVQRSNFVHVSTYDNGAPFYKTMKYRDTRSLNAMGKVLPPKQAHAANRRVDVHWGNHSVSGIGKKTICEGAVEIFHFPIRSHSQMISKFVVGGASLSRNAEKNAVSTWRKIYDEYLRNGDLEGYYKKVVYDEARLSAEIEMGKLVEDSRLASYMESLRI